MDTSTLERGQVVSLLLSSKGKALRELLLGEMEEVFDLMFRSSLRRVFSQVIHLMLSQVEVEFLVQPSPYPLSLLSSNSDKAEHANPSLDPPELSQATQPSGGSGTNSGAERTSGGDPRWGRSDTTASIRVRYSVGNNESSFSSSTRADTRRRGDLEFSSRSPRSVWG